MGSGIGPWFPPLVLVSAFFSVAWPALLHDSCVYVFVEADAEGGRAIGCEPASPFTAADLGRSFCLLTPASLCLHTAGEGAADPP